MLPSYPKWEYLPGQCINIICFKLESRMELAEEFDELVHMDEESKMTRLRLEPVILEMLEIFLKITDDVVALYEVLLEQL